MRGIVLAIMGLILILLVSYIAIGESNSFVMKTFVVEGNRENVETGYGGMKTFVVGQEPTGRSMLIEAKKKGEDARKRNIRYKQMEEEIDKCIERMTKNWKTTIGRVSYDMEYDEKEKKWVNVDGSPDYGVRKSFYGYDEEEYPMLRWRLRNRFLNGEKIC